MAELTVYTLDDVAKLLKMTKRTLYAYIDAGSLHAVKIGKSWRMTEEDVRDAMTELKALEAEARERKLPLLVCALNALGVPLYLPDHPADRSLNTRSLPELLAAELKTGDAERWISSATMKMAAFFRLWDRGLVREGMKADLVLVNPSLLPESEKGTIGGIEKVWVRGQLQIDALPELSDTIRSQTRVFGVRMPG